MALTSIATWNVNSLRVRLPQLGEWLASAQPDIIALQETKLPDPDFPTAEIAALGYEVAFSGQRTYNGVAVLSRLVARNGIGMGDRGAKVPRAELIAGQGADRIFDPISRRIERLQALAAIGLGDKSLLERRAFEGFFYDSQPFSARRCRKLCCQRNDLVVQLRPLRRSHKDYLSEMRCQWGRRQAFQSLALAALRLKLWSERSNRRSGKFQEP